MKWWTSGRAGKALRGVSLAVMLSLVATAAAPSIVHADPNDTTASEPTKKRSFFGKREQKANTAAHSPGSGTPATTETAVLNDGSVAPFITPDSVANMQAMADKYSKIVADGGWPRIGKGNQKKGAKGKNVGLLNQRLHIEGYLQAEGTQGEFAELFTSATEDALKRFQRNHGLAVTGKVDGATLFALNVPAQQRLATIKANMPRLAEYSKDLGERYIVVNIPAQQIETVSGGKVYSLHNAIVGRPSRPTPVVMTPLTIIRFNPYWNAPASIVEKDILPRMLSKGPSKIMADMNMKVFDGVGGPEVDPDKINWRKVRVDDYHFRQEPGGANAMATAKIEFNSPFGIYLHDTPEPHLFQTGSRFYSSGCVRVDKVAIMMDWILQGQDGLNAARIAELAQTKERLDTPLVNPPQLRVAYLTAWPAKDGVAAFRPDVYELDNTNFVVGQPLPVGESLDGQRYVLKPIPRLQQDIDTDDGFGFASLFRRGGKNDDVAMPGQMKKNGDSLISLNSDKAKKEAAERKLERQKRAEERAKIAKQRADQRAKLAKQRADERAKLAKKRADERAAKLAKADQKADASKAKKVVKKDDAKAAAKTKTAAKTPAKTPDKASASTAKKDPKATTAAAKPAAQDCKPGSDGKLPAGCKAPAAAPAKKPAAPADKTASATN